LSNHLWSKNDVVGGSKSAKTKGAAGPKESNASVPKPSSQNGKRVKSDAFVMSDDEIDQAIEAAVQSDESRFSDSEDDV
jgi:hypothetical protein